MLEDTVLSALSFVSLFFWEEHARLSTTNNKTTIVVHK
jgi:hypothetical protein